MSCQTIFSCCMNVSRTKPHSCFSIYQLNRHATSKTRKTAKKGESAPTRAQLTKNVDNSFVHCLEETQQILDEQGECSNGDFVAQLVNIELVRMRNMTTCDIVAVLAVETNRDKRAQKSCSSM